MILILLILILALDVYLFFALQDVLTLLEISPGLELLLLTAFAAFSLFAMIYILRQFAKRPTSYKAQAKDRIFAATIGSYMAKVFTSLILLLDDVRRGIYWFIQAIGFGDFSMDRTLLVSGGGLLLGAILFVLLIYGMIRNKHRYKIRRVNIPIKNIPKSLEGLKIVHISDIHSGSFRQGKPIQKGIQKINALQPDLIFFTGDLVNHVAEEIDPYISIFQQLESKFGTYSILGNHDYGDYVSWKDIEDKRANLNLLYRKHSEMGWELLLNEFRKINVDGAEIGIIGVENYSAHPRFAKYGDMQKATNGFEESDINILLSHDPTHWDDEIIKNYPFVDLTLSGHTHGFQFGIELSNKLRWSPIQYVYKKWAGLYQTGKQYLYVNRGFGYLGYHGRVGILPEITLLTIVADK